MQKVREQATKFWGESRPAMHCLHYVGHAAYMYNRYSTLPDLYRLSSVAGWKNLLGIQCTVWSPGLNLEPGSRSIESERGGKLIPVTQIS